MSATTTAILTDSDVPQGSTTFCPRLLLIDYKSKFGSLSHINALNVGEEDAPVDSTWTGPVSEHLQDPIPQSSYHTRLDAGEDEEDEDDLDVEMDEGEHDSVPDLTSSIRFWSDYSCVFYHPCGLHRIPDPAEWEREAGWPQGVKRFHASDTNQAVLEDSFRLFAEECHLLQHFFSSLPLPLSPIDVPVHCTYPPPFHALPLALLSASTAGSRGAKQHTPCTRWYLGPSQDHVYT
ncbi:hypothetical protein JB92DRAFT_3118569 [Gautieria morchelliformis]|nr:hypothetical protein JB92DRAFT_3118569 [Gautieria morchelliformis]